VITYVDTSTLIKLLIEEIGTTEAGLIWDEPDVLVSARVGHVEARAALAAARRQGRITNGVFTSAIGGLEVLWSQLSVVECDWPATSPPHTAFVDMTPSTLQPHTSSALTCSAALTVGYALRPARMGSTSPIRSTESCR
jgi:hypothetical protein